VVGGCDLPYADIGQNATAPPICVLSAFVFIRARFQSGVSLLESG